MCGCRGCDIHRGPHLNAKHFGGLGVECGRRSSALQSRFVALDGVGSGWLHGEVDVVSPHLNGHRVCLHVPVDNTMAYLLQHEKKIDGTLGANMRDTLRSI